MARETLKEVLMRRDELTEQEAETRIAGARVRLMELLAHDETTDNEAFDLCADEFGLEPDYLEDLI